MDMQALYGSLSPTMREALVFGGHDPLWLAQNVADNPYDERILRDIAQAEDMNTKDEN